MTLFLVLVDDGILDHIELAGGAEGSMEYLTGVLIECFSSDMCSVQSAESAEITSILALN